jgi:hypothetical protein
VVDDVERRKSCPYGDSKSHFSAVQPVATLYTDCDIPTPIFDRYIHLMKHPFNRFRLHETNKQTNVTIFSKYMLIYAPLQL